MEPQIEIVKRMATEFCSDAGIQYTAKFAQMKSGYANLYKIFDAVAESLHLNYKEVVYSDVGGYASLSFYDPNYPDYTAYTFLPSLYDDTEYELVAELTKMMMTSLNNDEHFEAHKREIDEQRADAMCEAWETEQL